MCLLCFLELEKSMEILRCSYTVARNTKFRMNDSPAHFQVNNYLCRNFEISQVYLFVLCFVVHGFDCFAVSLLFAIKFCSIQV